MFSKLYRKISLLIDRCTYESKKCLHIKVGEVYKTRSGRLVHITEVLPGYDLGRGLVIGVFKDTGNATIWWCNGNFLTERSSSLDLVELVDYPKGK